jgi:hypothetical protein
MLFFERRPLQSSVMPQLDTVTSFTGGSIDLTVERKAFKQR